MNYQKLNRPVCPRETAANVYEARCVKHHPLMLKYVVGIEPSESEDKENRTYSYSYSQHLFPSIRDFRKGPSGQKLFHNTVTVLDESDSDSKLGPPNSFEKEVISPLEKEIGSIMAVQDSSDSESQHSVSDE